MEFYFGREKKIFLLKIDKYFSMRKLIFFFSSKLINIAVPKTIDERAINLNYSKQDIFRQRENLELGKKIRKRIYFLLMK